jgi:dienelactone hydrolase
VDVPRLRSPRWLVLALLALSSGSLTGCWHFWRGPRELGACQGGVQYVETEYLGARSSTRVASGDELGESGLCAKRFRVAGFAPCGAGRHPVVFYVPGTFQPYDHAFIFRVLDRLARAGYLALSADYSNLWPLQGCDRYLPRAKCLFDAASDQSATARACALPQADCSSGIAVLGHSQGGLIAMLSADFEPRVRWVHALGVTAHQPLIAGDTACVLPSRRRLPADRLLVACGDCDFWFNGTRTNSCRTRSEGVTQGLERLTGLRCESSSSCVWKPFGAGAGARAGWIKVPSSAMSDGEADHCYMFRYGCLGFPDEEWEKDANLPWGLPAILEDLRRALPPAGP